MEMFRPPVNRMMKVLDRSFFQKNIPISVAKIVNKQHTSQLRQDLSQDRLYLDRIPSMARVPDDGRMDAKALLLRPEIKVNGGYSGIFLGIMKSDSLELIILDRCFNLEQKTTGSCRCEGSCLDALQFETGLRLLELSYVRDKELSCDVRWC